MGRLTLNVLLSFAQFEREVTAERIRDKIAASRKKGMWTGGNPPLGYDNIDKKLVVNEAEARSVHRLFELHRETGCIRSVLKTAAAEDILTKRRAKGSGGLAMTRGPLYFILANPIYVGKVQSGDALYDGEHQPIIATDLWDAIQSKSRAASQRMGVKSSRRNPLVSKLFADGERLTPSNASKAGRRYHYYVSHAGDKGRAASSIRWRLNADDVDAMILNAINNWIASPSAACDLLAESSGAPAIAHAREALQIMRAKDEADPARSPLSKWASRIERVDIDVAGVSIAIIKSMLLADADGLILAEQSVIRLDKAIGPKGHGLQLAKLTFKKRRLELSSHS